MKQGRQECIVNINRWKCNTIWNFFFQTLYKNQGIWITCYKKSSHFHTRNTFSFTIKIVIFIIILSRWHSPMFHEGVKLWRNKTTDNKGRGWVHSRWLPASLYTWHLLPSPPCQTHTHTYPRHRLAQNQGGSSSNNPTSLHLKRRRARARGTQLVAAEERREEKTQLRSRGSLSSSRLGGRQV